jgi:predicted  nucleic acid-binding Zn-ribbon protein
MVRDLDALLQLQTATQQAATARRELDSVPDSMREIHEQHSEHSERIQTLDAQIQQDELDRRSSEAAIADAQAKMEHFQAQINRVTTQREYGSLLKEIDAAKAIITEHEEESLVILERLETAQTELATQRSEFEELDQTYQAELAQWEQKKPAVADRLRELDTQIAELEGSIPRQQVGQFHRLYDRHDGEVFAVANKVQFSPRSAMEWHCSFCNYRVRPQAIVEIKNAGTLVPCESCHRFLKVEESA